MRTSVRESVVLGDLVVAAFDIAANYSRDSRTVSRLATTAVRNVLQRARSLPRPPSPLESASASRMLWGTAVPGLRKAQMRERAKAGSS